ncbi:MAG: GtrA family protein [Frankiaceae bacterium]
MSRVPLEPVTATVPDAPAPPVAPVRFADGIVARLRRRTSSRVGEVLSFGIIGAFNTIVDIAVFNVMLGWVLPSKPLLDKGVSIAVATALAYAMNRNITWAERARTGVRRELPLFAALSLVGLGISETALAISHYGLGHTSVLADNIAANVVGLVLASAWRFWSFRRWVFPPAELIDDDVLPTEPRLRERDSTKVA